MLEFINRIIERRRMAREGQLGTRKRRTESVFGAAMDRSMVFTLALAVILWVVCVTVLTITTNRDYPVMVKGQHAPATLYAQIDFTYEDRAETERLRQQTRDNQEIFFSFSESQTELIEKNLESMLEALQQRRQSERSKLRYAPEHDLIAEKVAALGPGAFNQLDMSIQQQRTLRENLKRFLIEGLINPADSPAIKGDTPVRVQNDLRYVTVVKAFKDLPTCDTVAGHLTASLTAGSKLSDSEKASIKDLMLVLLTGHGNLVVDNAKTREELERALKKVEPLMIQVKKHDIIVRRNDKITEKILDALAVEDELLKQYDRDRNFVEDLLHNAFWSLILILFAGFYLVHIHPEITRSSRSIALIVTVSAISLGINYVSMELFYFFSSMLEIPPGLLPDAVPLALTAVLLTVMSGYRVALYVGLFVSMVSAMMMKGSFNVALEGFVLSALCGLLVRPSSNYRSFFLRTFLCVAATVWLLDFNWFWHLTAAPGMIFYSLVLALANALFTAVAAMLMIFLFELIFNVSTNMSLMVLCDYNHPLLKELHLKAPGTSLHSQNVAVLAENAAAEIGANAVLARAGALFHDIGKIKNPEYFIENSQSGDNPHNRLSPRMSSLIISTHVKDGLDMALQYKICRKVRRFIQQHHGTDLIQYFYHIAVNTQNQVLESDYRYPGPLPHDKEVVIVSLADACEAACRSLEKPTASKIEGMVNDIFRKRWRDGQLDNADLTVEELSLINESFVYTLTTMYHSRIAYPKDENNDEDNVLVPEQAPSGTEQKTPAPGDE